MLKVTKGLLVDGVNAYSEAGRIKKEVFHKEGKKFLKNLAEELGLKKGDYDLRSNMGGIAVSGEVTLHTDKLYVQLYESCVGERGIHVLYRTCKGRKDYAGGSNNMVSMERLAENQGMGQFYSACHTMVNS
jgi:hypothetical protein